MVIPGVKVNVIGVGLSLDDTMPVGLTVMVVMKVPLATGASALDDTMGIDRLVLNDGNALSDAMDGSSEGIKGIRVAESVGMTV